MTVGSECVKIMLKEEHEELNKLSILADLKERYPKATEKQIARAMRIHLSEYWYLESKLKGMVFV